MKKPLSYSLITLLIIGLISGIGWHGLTTATNRTTTSQTTISESKGTSSSTKQRSAESSSATFSSASASSSNSASPLHPNNGRFHGQSPLARPPGYFKGGRHQGGLPQTRYQRRRLDLGVRQLRWLRLPPASNLPKSD